MGAALAKSTHPSLTITDLLRRTIKFSSAGRLANRRSARNRDGGRRLLQRLVRPFMLLQAKHQVDGPATANVRAGASAVPEQLPVLAAGVLQRVGQDRHGREVAALMHLAC